MGTVVPYEDLCLLIGHKSANWAATHVLRQYIGWLRGQLIATRAHYVITVAGEVGYGVCKMGGEPRLSATSRSATLPELGRNLRRVRTAAGLTQTALAKRSGIHCSYVSALGIRPTQPHRPDAATLTYDEAYKEAYDEAYREALEGAREPDRTAQWILERVVE